MKEPANQNKSLWHQPITTPLKLQAEKFFGCATNIEPVSLKRWAHKFRMAALPARWTSTTPLWTVEATTDIRGGQSVMLLLQKV